MELTRDDEINILYAIIRDSEDASARFDQKEAVRQIKRLAGAGNPDAVTVLNHLRKTPSIHPLFREIIFQVET